MLLAIVNVLFICLKLQDQALMKVSPIDNYITFTIQSISRNMICTYVCTYFLVADYALAMVDTPAFKAWEVHDAVPGRMAEEYANLSLADVATCLLHQAAYRDGLGNSLFAPQHMVRMNDAITFESLKGFACTSQWVLIYPQIIVWNFENFCPTLQTFHEIDV